MPACIGAGPYLGSAHHQLHWHRWLRRIGTQQDHPLDIACACSPCVIAAPIIMPPAIHNTFVARAMLHGFSLSPL
jgi:hypothetical protein